MRLISFTKNDRKARQRVKCIKEKRGGDIIRKNFLIGFFILATFLLEGCSILITEKAGPWRPYGAEGEHSDAYWERYDEVNTKGVKLAKQFYIRSGFLYSKKITTERF